MRPKSQMSSSHAVQALTFLLLVALMGMAFPQTVGASPAAVSVSVPAPSMLVGNGTSVADVLAVPVGQPAYQPSPTVPDLPTAPGAVVLGADNPVQTIINGLLNNTNQVQADAKFIHCAGDPKNDVVSLIRSDCASSLVGALAQTALDITATFLPAAISAFVGNLGTELVNAARFMTNLLLTNMLGSQGNSTIVHDPHLNQSWFLGQFSVMRQIAILLLLPVLMIVVIQSIFRGSLYFLLRSVLVMLPIAILGTAVAVKGTELLVSITNDISADISSNLLNSADYSTKLDNSLAALGTQTGKFGLFTLVWFAVLIGGAIAVYLELLVREFGVYLAGLFLPIGFATLVWPSASKWFSRLVQIIVALIFSKLVITLGISVGVAAVASGINTSVAGTSSAAANLTVIQGGGVLFFMSAWFGHKLYGFTPAAMAATQGRYFPPEQFSIRGQRTNNVIGGIRNSIGRSAASVSNVSSTKPFQNSGAP